VTERFAIGIHHRLGGRDYGIFSFGGSSNSCCRGFSYDATCHGVSYIGWIGMDIMCHVSYYSRVIDGSSSRLIYMDVKIRGLAERRFCWWIGIGMGIRVVYLPLLSLYFLEVG